MAQCNCCVDELNVPDTLYVKLHGMDNYPFNFAQCDVPCEAINGVCFALHRTGACAWQGTLLQNATCYPVSTMSVNISCAASSVTLTAIWIQSGSALARFVKVINGPSQIDCLACTVHELSNDLAIPGDATGGNRCRPNTGYVEVAFGPIAECCEFCADQFQVTFMNFSFPDELGKCTAQNCFDYFGNDAYLLNFTQSGTEPSFWVQCAVPQGAFCEYSAPLGLRCTDTRYGFCSLHLFIRTDNNCQTQAIVEVRTDEHVSDNCNAQFSFQAWRTNGFVNQRCTILDVTLDGISNQCVDRNWNCESQGGSIRIQAV